jgi:hypothetical protein
MPPPWLPIMSGGPFLPNSRNDANTFFTAMRIIYGDLESAALSTYQACMVRRSRKRAHDCHEHAAMHANPTSCSRAPCVRQPRPQTPRRRASKERNALAARAEVHTAARDPRAVSASFSSRRRCGLQVAKVHLPQTSIVTISASKTDPRGLLRALQRAGVYERNVRVMRAPCASRTPSTQSGSSVLPL